MSSLPMLPFVADTTPVRTFSVLRSALRDPAQGVILHTLDAAIAIARQKAVSGTKVGIWEGAPNAGWFKVTLVVKKRRGVSFEAVPDPVNPFRESGRRRRSGRIDPTVYLPTYGQPDDELESSAFEPCRVWSCERVADESGRCADHT